MSPIATNAALSFLCTCDSMPTYDTSVLQQPYNNPTTTLQQPYNNPKNNKQAFLIAAEKKKPFSESCILKYRTAAGPCHE